MIELLFSKMSGSGNDFIIIDNMNGFFKGNVAELAKDLCRRKFSIGADGLILLEKSHKADFMWRFHNQDGSEAEMCGNGARCASLFAVQQKIADKKLSFETKAGIIQAEVKDNGSRVKIQLTDPYDLKRNIDTRINEKENILTYINTGVPHAVVTVPDINNVDIASMGSKIRYHNSFKPEGSNVNFIQAIDGHTVSVRTYERGVEDETLACGTGAVASAIIAHLNGNVTPPVTVITRGGEMLQVFFKIEKEKITEVYLEGDTTLVYQGKVLKNV